MSRNGLPLPRALVAGVLALLLAGCASETGFEYPEFEQWSTLAPQPDCASVVLELRRVDAVRWSMREDGLEVADYPRRAMLGALQVLAIALDPIGGVVNSAVYGDANSYGPEHTLEQAERRLVRLLQRKRQLGCPPTPTARSGVSDMDLLAEVEELNSRRKDGEISDWREAGLRSELMDQLHASGGGRQ